jgi:pilus assembly protein CpaF
VKILMVVGGKGGVGATTLSVDLAKRYAERGPTLLVDGDLSGRRAEASLFNNFEALDNARNDTGFGVANVAKDLTLFEIAASIHDGFTVKADKIEEFFRIYRDTGTTIVLDAPQPFAAAVRPFAVRATGFLIVVEPTLLGATSGRAMQLELTRFGVPASRMVYVTNTPRRIEVKRQKIEKALGVSVAAEIPPPDDRQYQGALNAVVSAVESLPDAELLTLRPSAATPLGERRLNQRAGPPGPQMVSTNGSFEHRTAPQIASADARDALKTAIHKELARRVDFAAISASDQLRADEVKSEVVAAVSELLREQKDIGSAEDAARLQQEIFDEALGFGPLEDLLRDQTIDEVMVCGPNKVYIERAGKIEHVQKAFADEQQMRLVIERMVAPLGRRIDEASPMVDARLPDGSRLNATLPPVTIDGPTITIRRFGGNRMDINDLVERGTLNSSMADFLRACVEARLNIIISGGTGSGKTTMLNVLSRFLPSTERIITIEDAAELYLDQDHVVRMESRPANVEGRGEIKIRDLVRNALRMRPDRIVVGECRGGEALDMLQAMNTGHDGSLTTIHANTPRDCLARIETMVLMAGYDIPVRAIREQVVSAIDLIVQVSRMRDGSRKILSISEVIGLESDVVTMMEVARFQQTGADKEGTAMGTFVYTGVQPQAIARFKEYGVTFDVQRFNEMKMAVSFAQ